MILCCSVWYSVYCVMTVWTCPQTLYEWVCLDVVWTSPHDGLSLIVLSRHSRLGEIGQALQDHMNEYVCNPFNELSLVVVIVLSQLGETGTEHISTVPYCAVLHCDCPDRSSKSIRMGAVCRWRKSYPILHQDLWMLMTSSSMGVL